MNNNQKQDSCDSCMFYDNSDCRRYPPKLIAYENDGHVTFHAARFPRTDGFGWCGEFKEKQDDR